MIILAVMPLRNRFVDFYAVLGVRSDASHEEIWAAYNRKKDADGSLGADASGRRLLGAAIAVLGTEEKRLAYDFNGDGGDVGFEIYEDKEQPSASDGFPQDGTVIHGSDRIMNTPETAQANPPTENFALRANANTQTFAQMPGTTQTGTSADNFTLRTNAYARGEALGGSARAAQPRPSERVRGAMDAAEEDGLSLFLSKATVVLGLLFALLLSIAWMMEMPAVGSFVPAGSDSPLRLFIDAANGTNIIALWIFIFVGGFALWCAELFIILLATHALPSPRPGARPRHGRLLRAEISLFLLLCAVSALLPRVRGFPGGNDYLMQAARDALSLLCFFTPLFITAGLERKQNRAVLIRQICLILGHMFFVLLLSLWLTGRFSPADYFIGGLFKFGYVSWWILFHFAHGWFVRMQGR